MSNDNFINEWLKLYIPASRIFHQKRTGRPKLSGAKVQPITRKKENPFKKGLIFGKKRKSKDES